MLNREWYEQEIQRRIREYQFTGDKKKMLQMTQGLRKVNNEYYQLFKNKPEFGKHDFLPDLSTGKNKEIKIGHLLARILELNCSFSSGVCKEYDFCLSHGDFKLYFEVKADLKHKLSRCVAIELTCNGVLSGINATNSQVWISYLNGLDCFVIVSAAILREVLARGIQEGHVEVMSAVGEGGRVKLALIPDRVLMEREDVAIINIKNDRASFNRDRLTSVLRNIARERKNEIYGQGKMVVNPS